MKNGQTVVKTGLEATVMVIEVMNMLTKEEMKKRFARGFVSQSEFLGIMREDAKTETQVVEHKKTRDGQKELHTWNIPAAFDIETTQYKEDKVAFMYIWMICVNGVSTYGRTWDEFESLMEEIRKIFNVNEERKFVIYIHNEGFEMSFMMPRYYKKIKNYFALDTHQPVKVDFDGFLFKDSLTLSAESLRMVGDNLTTFHFRKMVGDLDYSKYRNSLTPLTEKEMGYCLNDVRVLCAYIWEQSKMYKNITKIPMTNTGRVREYVRESCLYGKTKSGKRVRNKKFCEYIKNKKMTPELYAFAKRAFMGGFTHAGHLNAGTKQDHVASMDFTSSYPAVIVSEMFPTETPQEVKYDSWDEYYKDVSNGMGVLLAVEIRDVNDGKFPYEHYLSASRMVEIGQPKKRKDGSVSPLNYDHTKLDNGRIVSTDRAVLVCTEQDWDIIAKTYDIGYAKIIKAYRFHKDYFPKEMLNCLLTLYEDKTTLKDVEGKEAEYLVKKQMCNSFYGMMVQDIINAIINWDPENGWEYEPADQGTIEKQIDGYNKSGKRFTYFIDGLYITAYARHNLWEGIQELKGDYCYSDTDSVKYLNAKDHEKFFADYNKRIDKKIDDCLNARGIDPNRARPKTVKGETKPLGEWDYEGYYDGFKTLGAKRYIISGFHRPDGSVKKEYMITIAGVGKVSGGDWIFSQDDPFDYFNDLMVIPGKAEDKDGNEINPSGRLVSYYRDKPYGGVVVDEFGNAEMMEECGGCCLVETDYTMDMSDEYMGYIDLQLMSSSKAVAKIRTQSAVEKACK